MTMKMLLVMCGLLVLSGCSLGFKTVTKGLWCIVTACDEEPKKGR